MWIVTKERKAKKISQTRLAQLTGIPRSRITAIECGYKEPEEKEVHKLRSAIAKYKKGHH